ncbi:MAG: Na/Pi cotransporter family protein [Clostridia bacterium]|nr:Na/Pi cotransporter family protein [Clostridia bacterium]
MTIFDALTMIGGLCLFLFGMSIMGDSLERSAGSKLKIMLGKLTTNKFMGLLTGLCVTAVIQSSSATTVMVVGFVNSGLMTLKQAIHVIMGANIGTTVTAWILSLGGISGDNIILKLMKPMSFTPVLALIGIALFMFAKSNKRKDVGTILLGFSVLMFGMDIMSDAVSGLSEVPAFRNLFIMFENPILGVLAGALVTAVIQSSSASVGILQAFASTGQITYGSAIPIIMGQNIGTCITAIISSFGTNKNAKRAAAVHLSFNILGTVICLSAFSAAKLLINIPILNDGATAAGIAVIHSVFNIACTLLLLPVAGLLEKMAVKLVPDAKEPEAISELDERLLATSAIALERCYDVTSEMAKISYEAVKNSITCLESYDASLADSITASEDRTDKLEDMIGSYLVKLSTHSLNEEESAKASVILKAIGDLERLGDHAKNILESAEELMNKHIEFTPDAKKELKLLCGATLEICSLSCTAFTLNDEVAAAEVEPLEQVIDKMKELLRSRHIDRLTKGDCSIEAGFVWSDLITNMERISDHCSNIAVCVAEQNEKNMNAHASLKLLRSDSTLFKEKYEKYADKYINAVTAIVI